MDKSGRLDLGEVAKVIESLMEPWQRLLTTSMCGNLQAWHAQKQARVAGMSTLRRRGFLVRLLFSQPPPWPLAAPGHLWQSHNQNQNARVGCGDPAF